ncbi:MAG: protein phosphatase 2C domain-containing protein [Clostridia bacterium]|nr:protein phosphatase 2C domain-containing protein [Clostridia bacterium]
MFPAHNEAKETDRLFILCDGMGGHDAGEVASATVCEAMSKSILAAVPDVEGDFPEAVLNNALADAFAALDEKDDGTAKRKMGTTMTLLKLYDKGCCIAHIGDSRVYHIRPGKRAEDTKILFRTEDHSLVNDLIKIGELTVEEAKHSRQKNVITRAMQPHTERRPKADVYRTSDIRPGDYFYLCSDGMLENMEDYQLCYFFSQAAGDDENKRKSLLKATEENRDNHSAIIVHILDVKNPVAVTDNAAGKSDSAAVKSAGAPVVNHTGKARKKGTCIVWAVVIVVLLLAVAYSIVSDNAAKSCRERQPEEVSEPSTISKPVIPRKNLASVKAVRHAASQAGEQPVNGAMDGKQNQPKAATSVDAEAPEVAASVSAEEQEVAASVSAEEQEAATSVSAEASEAAASGDKTNEGSSTVQQETDASMEQ